MLLRPSDKILYEIANIVNKPFSKSAKPVAEKIWRAFLRFGLRRVECKVLTTVTTTATAYMLTLLLIPCK